MQVKVCPKCGSENRADRNACSSCYTSLESVQLTEAKEQPLVGAARPAAPSSPSPQPAPSAPPPPNYGPPPGAPPSFSERRPAPAQRGVNWGAIVLVILLLGGAGFGAWWFFLKPASPEAVVQKFRNASSARDYDAFKSCLCQSNIATMQKAPGGEQALRAQWEKAPKAPPTKDASYTTTYENSGTTAVVEMKPKDQGSPSAGTEFVLLQEDGKWKIDLQATVLRTMKKKFPNGVPGTPPQ